VHTILALKSSEGVFFARLDATDDDVASCVLCQHCKLELVIEPCYIFRSIDSPESYHSCTRTFVLSTWFVV